MNQGTVQSQNNSIQQQYQMQPPTGDQNPPQFNQAVSQFIPPYQQINGQNTQQVAQFQNVSHINPTMLNTSNFNHASPSTSVNYMTQQNQQYAAQVNSLVNSEQTSTVEARAFVSSKIENLSSTLVSKAIDSVYNEEIKRDFEKLCKLNLIDDEDDLDNLYKIFPLFESKELAFNTLVTMYSEKEAELFVKYPSLLCWLYFNLMILITSSEASLILKCKSSVGEIPKVSNNKITHLLGKRKANFKKVEEEPITEKEIKFKNHIIYNDDKTKHYLNNQKMLFSIGMACKYNVPIEFGGMFMKVMNSDIRKYNNKTGNVPAYYVFSGLRIEFDRKVVSSVFTKYAKTFPFVNVMFFSKITDVIKALSEKQYTFDTDPINVGSGSNQTICDVFQGSTIKCGPQKIEFDLEKNLHVTLISDMYGFFSNKEIIKFNTFSNFYAVPQYVLNPSEKMIEDQMENLAIYELKFDQYKKIQEEKKQGENQESKSCENPKETQPLENDEKKETDKSLSSDVNGTPVDGNNDNATISPESLDSNEPEAKKQKV